MSVLDDPAPRLNEVSIEDFHDWVAANATSLREQYYDYIMANPEVKTYAYHYAEWVLNRFKLCQLFPDTSLGRGPRNANGH